MALLEDFNTAQAEIKTLREQLAASAGQSTRIAELTSQVAALTGEKTALETSISKLTGEVVTAKAATKAAEDALPVAVAAKEKECNLKTATEAARIIAAAGGAPISTAPAPKPGEQEQSKQLKGRARTLAAFQSELDKLTNK